MVNQVGGSAIQNWATFAPVGDGYGQVITLMLIFVQLVGLIAFGNGALKTIRYVTPGHPKAPPTLGLTIIQMVVGIFALVPDRVYAFTVSVIKEIGFF